MFVAPFWAGCTRGPAGLCSVSGTPDPKSGESFTSPLEPHGLHEFHQYVISALRFTICKWGLLPGGLRYGSRVPPSDSPGEGTEGR